MIATPSAAPRDRRGTVISRRERAATIVVLAAAALLFLAGLGRVTLFDQDEAKYTQLAREILRTGDPITLHINGRPWFVHPPLYMWLVAAVGGLFGFTEFTARVWSAVFGVIGVYATVLIGRRLFGRRTALLAAVILPATFQYFAQSRLAIFDVVLVAFMLLAFHAFLGALYDHDVRQSYYAAVWAGLGTLTKGPIALLLPALVAGAFLVARRRTLRWMLPWIPPFGVYAAIALPWYLVETQRHGWSFITAVIGYYTVHRFVGVVEGQSGPWWYYGPVFGLGAFPWTAFLVAMIPYHLRRRGADGSLLVLLWIVITVLFYTAAGTKLPNYVLPAYPFAALGVAALWDAGWKGERAARTTLTAAFLGTVVALLLFAMEIVTFARVQYTADLAALQAHLIILAVVVAACLLAAAALYGLRRPAASFVALAATLWVFAGILVFRTLPIVDARRPVRPMAAAVLAALRPDTALVGFRTSDQQTLLYYTNHVVFWMDDLPTLVALVCTQPRMIVVTRPDDLRAWRAVLPTYADPPVRSLLVRDDIVVLEVGRAPSCRPSPRVGR